MCFLLNTGESKIWHRCCLQQASELVYKNSASCPAVKHILYFSGNQSLCVYKVQMLLKHCHISEKKNILSFLSPFFWWIERKVISLLRSKELVFCSKLPLSKSASVKCWAFKRLQKKMIPLWKCKNECQSQSNEENTQQHFCLLKIANKKLTTLCGVKYFRSFLIFYKWIVNAFM